MRRLFRLALLLPVLMAPVVAAALVPDPSWLGGWFDGADGDEIAALVFDRGEAMTVPVIAPPVPAGVASLALVLAPAFIAAPARPHPSRAPPAVA